MSEESAQESERAGDGVPDDRFVGGATVHEGSHEEGNGPRRRRRRPRLRLRLNPTTAAVVFAVVGISAAAWWRFGRPHGSTSSSASGGAVVAAQESTTSTSIEVAGRSYDPGDCVIWDQQPGRESYRDSRVVPCSESHLLEMTGSISLADRFDHYPTPDELTSIYQTDCRNLARQFLGTPLDPYGRFVSGGLEPTQSSWERGDRTVWCGIGASPAPGAPPGIRLGTLVPFNGEVRGVPQALLYDKGACLTADVAAQTVRGVVDCNQPHAFEVTGSVDLTGRTNTDPMGADAERIFGPLCEPLARAYLGRSLRQPEGSGWLPIPQASWDAGQRTLQCTVARYTGSTPTNVSGSLRDQST